MSKSRASGRKLQIITEPHYESHQLDLLSFVNDHALADLSLKDKHVRTSLAKSNTPKIPALHFHGDVDKNKTFSNFCLGEPNQLAAESIKRFLVNNESDYNVIYLFSSSGLGKTHILHAVANELKVQKKSFYLSTPRLMSQSIDHYNALKFYDFVLIDDLEEIEGDYELQKTFCQLMDFAKAKKIKLILTGDKRPGELMNCQERFKGKLSSALIHQLYDLSEELAQSIVLIKSQAMHFVLSKKVRDLVAKHMDFNVYGLESLLHKLKNTYEIKNQEITHEMVVQEMRAADKLYHQEDFRKFLKQVSNVFQIRFEDLTSSLKRKDFSLARHVAMYILKEKHGLSVMRISELFHKDHSSVIYGITRIKREISEDLKIQNKVHKILEESGQQFF